MIARSVLEEKRKQAYSIFKESRMPSFRQGLTMHLQVGKIEFPSVRSEDEVLRHDEEGIAERFLYSLVLPEDKLRAFHCAHARVRIIQVLPGEERILSLKRSDSSSHVLIVAGKGSSVVVIDADQENEGELSTRGLEVVLEEDVRFTLVSLQRSGRKVFFWRGIRAASGSCANVFDIVLGGDVNQTHSRVYLDGKNASVDVKAAFFGVGCEQVENGVEVVHSGECTASNIMTWGAVLGNAKGIALPKVHITAKAKYAKGYEVAELLVLERSANGNAVPVLLIDNPDVVCGHAARIGHLDEDAVFYLCSRGLSLGDAKRLIIEGFFAPMMDVLPDEEVRKDALSLIEERLGCVK